MQSFKQFINEASENYDKISDDRKKELIKYHENMANTHVLKSKEHKKIKYDLNHSIAAEAHRDAAQLHSYTANSLINNINDANEFKTRAENMSKGANARSELANK